MDHAIHSIGTMIRDAMKAIAEEWLQFHSIDHEFISNKYLME